MPERQRATSGSRPYKISAMPIGQPMAVPSSGTPLKNTVRFQPGAWRARPCRTP